MCPGILAARAAETYYGMQTHCIFTEHSSVLEVHTMKKAGIRLLFCILAGIVFVSCLAGSAAAADSQVSSDDFGYIHVTCNVDGAFIMVCGKDKSIYDMGYIHNGSCKFAVMGPGIFLVYAYAEGYAPDMCYTKIPEKEESSSVDFTLTKLDSVV